MNRNLAFSTLLLSAISATALAQTSPNTTTTTTTTVDTPTGTTSTKTTETTDGLTQYRKTVTATTRYDAGPFRAPSGYTYSRYGVGDHVPTVLLSGDVDLSDYSTYALLAPPAPLKWIRVGDDALLVSRDNGEVIQADYGLFRG
jgi:Ni/Co efflux regulator RcnB